MSNGYTEAKAWKKNKSLKPVDLELPSGNVALVRAPGLQYFFEQGMIPNPLLAIIKEALDLNSGKKDQDKPKKGLETNKMLEEIAGDPEKLQSMFQLVDAVTVACVLKPEVQHPPENPEDRDDDALYIDEVDMEDKFFIFNFACGGAKTVEQFREESASVMDSASHSSTAVRPTKRTGGAAKAAPRKSTRQK